MSANKFSTIKFETSNNIATVTLDRPEYRNAFNDVVISELFDAYKICAEDKNLRIVILRGAGKTFCAGADLNWMKSMKDYTYKENLQDAKQFADLLNLMHTIEKATISVIQGDVYGGGVGLAVIPDVVVCDENSSFTFTELKFGIIPACISPYVLKRIPQNLAKYLYLTQEKITAKKAFEIGLVDIIANQSSIESVVREICRKILQSSPEAVSICKKFLDELADKNLAQQIDYSVQSLANIRTSLEAKEGFSSFFEKRKPKWIE